MFAKKGTTRLEAGFTSDGKMVCKITYCRGWLRSTTIYCDAVSFLLISEMLCRHALKNNNTDFKWEGDIGGQRLTVEIPAYVVPTMAEVCASGSAKLVALFKDTNVSATMAQILKPIAEDYVAKRSALLPDTHEQHPTVQ